MNKEDLIDILTNNDFENILITQVKNGSSSGRIFVPRKYLDMDAIIIIRDVGHCPHCKGTGKR